MPYSVHSVRYALSQYVLYALSQLCTESFTYSVIYAPSQYVLYTLRQYVLSALSQYVLYALSQYVLYALSQYMLYALMKDYQTRKLFMCSNSNDNLYAGCYPPLPPPGTQYSRSVPRRGTNVPGIAATILQIFSASLHISNIDYMYIKSYGFRLFSSLPVSHLLWSSQSFGHQKAINGFDMPLPVAVCSGLVNPLAPRKVLVHQRLWKTLIELERSSCINLCGLSKEVLILTRHGQKPLPVRENLQVRIQKNLLDKFFAAALAVLVTVASQSRQRQSHHRFFPVDTSLIHIESRKSPTKSLFDVGSRRISIFTVNTKEYHSDVLAIITRIMRRT
ncbi:hypothetical protein Tco_1369508 [Tanacetum coccineum]